MTLNWTPTPADPEVFHITRVENLASIAQRGLLSDSQVNQAQGRPVVIGNPSIKQRRLTWQLNLPDRPLVGDFVPFYFCPRSVMLYLVACGTAGGQAGQDGVVHLVSRVSRLANLGQRCVFTDANAATSYAAPCEDLRQIPGVLDWSALAATDWRDSAVKSARQAEFLVANGVPWTAFEAIVVRDTSVFRHATTILAPLVHRPLVRIERSWYYP